MTQEEVKIFVRSATLTRSSKTVRDPSATTYNDFRRFLHDTDASKKRKKEDDGDDDTYEDGVQPPKRRRTSHNTVDHIHTNDEISPRYIDLASALVVLDFDQIEEEERVVLKPFETPSIHLTKLQLSITNQHHQQLRAQLTLSKNDRTIKLESIITDGQKETLNILRDVSKALDATKHGPHSAIVRVECSILPDLNNNNSFTRLMIRLKWKLGVSAVEAPDHDAAHLPLELMLLRKYFKTADTAIGAQWSLQDFYENVHSTDGSEELVSEIQNSRLTAKLYPFQQRAVKWLLRREGVEFRQGKLQAVEKPSSTHCVPATFSKATTRDGTSCLVSQERCMVVEKAAQVKAPLNAWPGGILAEEMGLGKTVELIALITSHTRPQGPAEVFDENVRATVEASGTTLIVTPPSLVEQWKEEIATHAPLLSVHEYTGIPPATASRKKKEEATVENLRRFDIVITTYTVLAREIYFAQPPASRNLRHAKVHESRRSPLVQLSWWRVCLDEAQMIESGVSQAAKVARLIPRVNAWAVTGTPLRRNVQDLRGLLQFLRYEPYNSSAKLWETIDKATFRRLFQNLALRHTKADVRKELTLPPQRRVVVTIPFTVVEEQNYTELVKQMCDELGVDTAGGPMNDDWDPRDPRTVEAMREWLARLRQTCLHPQVGGKNRRALGRGAGPLRTVAEVLEVMIDQCDTAIRSEESECVLSMLTRGHIHAYAKDKPERKLEALEIYQSTLVEADRFVAECRANLAEELKKERTKQRSLSKAGGAVWKNADSDDDDEPHEDERLGRVGVARNAVRRALEAQHACNFWIGTVYYQIKMLEDLTVPESDDFNRKEKLEADFYERAKLIRKELTRETRTHAERSMRNLSAKAKDLNLPAIEQIEDLGGIENRRLLPTLDHLTKILNEQADCLQLWRQKVVEILLLPLLDEDNEDVTGEEYEQSTKQQDELYVYTTALRALIADRSEVLTGLQNHRVDQETKYAGRQAANEEGHAPQLMLELLQTREKLKMRAQEDSPNVRRVINELNHLIAVSHDKTTDRAMSEARIAQQMHAQVRKIYEAEMKSVTALEAELSVFHSVMNRRVQYFAQLQQVSDTVQPYKEEEDETIDQRALDRQDRKEDSVKRALAAARTKRRFLGNLSNESEKPEPRTCIICTDAFEVGVLTICGHQFCKLCIDEWLSKARSCPTCKRTLKNEELHNITYKPQELRAQEEHTVTNSPAAADSPASGTSIYSDMSNSTMDEIQSIDLRGSYGTKIDTIARHMLWLRQTERGCKTIVFSQFSDFLEVLENAFERFGISYASIHRKGGITSFRTDATKQCFLLDAKSDSSGLNLVNATHVFLCEPLINPTIELQAIARVHRIGQTRTTTVYMYLVSGTVEEAIYETSVARRLAHMGRVLTDSREDSRAQTPANQEDAIDTANSLEMQKAPISTLLVQKKGAGEIVATDDLWSCLFGKLRPQPASRVVQREVARHLRAEAADKRAASSAAAGVSSSNAM